MARSTLIFDSSCGDFPDPIDPDEIDIEDTSIAAISKTNNTGVLKINGHDIGQTNVTLRTTYGDVDLRIKVSPVTETTFAFAGLTLHTTEAIAYMPGTTMHMHATYFNQGTRLEGTLATPWGAIEGPDATWAPHTTRHVFAPSGRQDDEIKGPVVPDTFGENAGTSNITRLQSYTVPEMFGVYTFKGRGAGDVRVHVVNDAQLTDIALCDLTDINATAPCLMFKTNDVMVAAGQPTVEMEMETEACEGRLMFHQTIQRWLVDVQLTEDAYNRDATQGIDCTYKVHIPGGRDGQGVTRRLTTSLDWRGNPMSTKLLP